jgi:DNA-binding transcriptional regulator YiaG
MASPKRAAAALERLRAQEQMDAPERLCALREASRLSEEGLGELLAEFGGKVSGPTVHEWEHRSRRPGEENKQKLERWSIEAIRKLGVATRPVFVGDWPSPAAVTSDRPVAP